MNDRASIRELATGVLQKLAEGPGQAVLDRGVARSTSAARLCEQLEGRSLQIDPGALGPALFFTVVGGRLLMKPGRAEEPDATLAGSPLALARLSAGDPQRVIRGGDVSIDGDAEVAEAFQYLLQFVRPDPEEELSRFTGDAVAHEAGEIVRGLSRWSEGARMSFNRSLGEYLTEESGALPTAVEVDEFCAEVDALATDVDRLEARLRILRAALATD